MQINNLFGDVKGMYAILLLCFKSLDTKLTEIAQQTVYTTNKTHDSIFITINWTITYLPCGHIKHHNLLIKPITIKWHVHNNLVIFHVFKNLCKLQGLNLIYYKN